MADKNEGGAETSPKSTKKPLIIGAALALIGGGGGFYAVQSGLVLPSDSHGGSNAAPAETAHGGTATMADVAYVYVPIEPLVISLGDGLSGKHLRFRAELEVVPSYRSEVEHLMPRIVDVLNSYLRAVEMRDLTDSAALLRLRTQIMRRLQIVTGGDRVNDLLIMEFVLN